MRDEIERQIRRYLNRLSNRAELRSWLFTNRQLILESSDPNVAELADQIHSSLIDVDDGLLAEGELRRLLNNSISG